MKLKTIINKSISKMGYELKKIPKYEKREPSEYSTVGSEEVPCQKESYFMRLTIM